MLENKQNVADMLKGLVLDKRIKTGAERKAKRDALEAISHFETVGWNYRAFERAITDTGQRFALDNNSKIVYAGEDIFTDVIAVIQRFHALMPQPVKRAEPVQLSPDEIPTMTTKQAAEYLNVKRVTMKKYVYHDHLIEGTLVTRNTRMFSKAELDRFNEQHKPKVGRPFKKIVETE